MSHTTASRPVLALTVALGLAVAGRVQAQEAKPAGKTELTWRGHAAFILKTPGGATIAVDPWLDNPKAPKGAAAPAALDAILITHAHFDHVGQAAELARKTGAKVYGSFELVGLLGLGDKGVGANAGGALRIKDVTVHLVEAVHSSGYTTGMEDKQPPRYGGAPVGYVIAVDKGPVLYHAGDTDAFASMALIGERYHPTHALLPIGGHFTMDPPGAAMAARMLKAGTVVPMHFGTFPALAGTPAQLKSELDKAGVKARLLELRPGEATAL